MKSILAARHAHTHAHIKHKIEFIYFHPFVRLAPILPAFIESKIRNTSRHQTKCGYLKRERKREKDKRTENLFYSIRNGVASGRSNAPCVETERDEGTHLNVHNNMKICHINCDVLTLFEQRSHTKWVFFYFFFSIFIATFTTHRRCCQCVRGQRVYRQSIILWYMRMPPACVLCG